MMETLSKGSANSKNHPTTAWPASWYATVLFSSFEMTLFFFSSPPITRSIAASKSVRFTNSLSALAAIRAASLHTFAMSAPANPGVRAARRSLKYAMSFSTLILARCTLKICSRPMMSGRSRVICLSNLPGLSKALSRMSGLFVPARITTPLEVAKPSISTRSWLRVFSLSSFPPAKPPLPLARPIASISSINIMEGDCDLACANRSRTLAGPTPTNISMKSLPLIDRKGTAASPAVAFARRVLPVPGGPTSSAPFGILAPRSRYLDGSLRNWTNSMISALASLHPATSLKVILFFAFLSRVVT
mmetsp:Transcript_4097/g.10491  ORF Transcript_4097/g.10491 Transcript_4097/m.10491 type:complete len:304 (+) Transcript_4097:621-1532(+)